jgi:hypothetical protein
VPTPSPRSTPARLRRTLTAIALTAGVGWLALRAVPVAWIETTWLQRVLPPSSRWTAALIDLVPFSWTIATLVALPVVLVALSRRRRLPWLPLLAALVALGAFGFDLAWGIAYRRVPLEDRLALTSSAPGSRDLFEAFDTLAAIARRAAPADASAVETGAGWPAASWSSASHCVARADAVVSERARPLRLPTVVRRLPPGTLLVGGFGGVVGPWLREPHVDGGLPPVAALATGLHELAHTAGWAGEAQTDALATLAGLVCDADEVRFAAAVHGLGLIRNDLRRVTAGDPASRAELDARVAGLPLSVSRATAAARSAAERYAWPAAEALAATTYDAYLRSQGVEAGLADYGRASVLITATLVRCQEDPTASLCPDRP